MKPFIENKLSTPNMRSTNMDMNMNMNMNINMDMNMNTPTKKMEKKAGTIKPMGAMVELSSTKSIESASTQIKTDDPSKPHSLITLEHCFFTWDDDGHQDALVDVSLKFPKGKITMIIGKTGSGKSGMNTVSLLRAMLGGVHKTRGRLIYGQSPSDPNRHIKIGYSSQVAWIQNATVKDNVLFGGKYRPTFYDNVIKACALEADLAILPAGDSTEIGEKGINLSGGQKQRVSLARAVYGNYDVLLFDDPLSAVDSHVANHIFNECFLKLLTGKQSCSQRMLCPF
ncbi:hypothetical protein RFI_35446 [Reticulomyxa filosa]|uniref:ABC transporter domain-containing protein n=1 Tax=Reticulomyxa filosa TaxID=46433 RepID=X6LLI4_RETFI|nr:hypothetical protein RFI_35446 [Reticulomyxa filosa]|eukprot:ETO01992.1 hypothetical protein RFI_35446 [Reticulomyxa filosa]